MPNFRILHCFLDTFPVGWILFHGLHRLSAELHRLYVLGGTGYLVDCTGYRVGLHRLYGVKTNNNVQVLAWLELGNEFVD